VAEALQGCDCREEETSTEDCNEYVDYTYVEPLDAPEGGNCEACDDEKPLTFWGEKNGHRVELCEECGKAIDRYLYGNGGRFE